MNAPSDVTFVLHHEKQNVFIQIQVNSRVSSQMLSLFEIWWNYFNTVTETKIDVKWRKVYMSSRSYERSRSINHDILKCSYSIKLWREKKPRTGFLENELNTEVCSTERALTSTHQNPLYLQHKFWWALPSAHSVEHASELHAKCEWYKEDRGWQTDMTNDLAIYGGA